MTLTLSLLAFLASQTTEPEDPILPPPAALSYGGFYAKCAYFRSLPILGSSKVDDRAFHVLIATFDHMLAICPADPIPALLAAKSHYSIIAATEGQTDLPEYRDMRNDPKTDWNKRARGLGRAGYRKGPPPPNPSSSRSRSNMQRAKTGRRDGKRRGEL